MADFYADWIHVVGPPGEAADTARRLLDAAADPREVRSVGTGGEFLVPAYVADAYHATPEPAAPPARRRAKKTAEETES